MNFGGDDFLNTGMTLGQFGFMAESEGEDDLIDTTDTRFNAVIKQIKTELAWAKHYDGPMTEEVNEILLQHGISPHELTSTQLARIKKIIS